MATQIEKYVIDLLETAKGLNTNGLEQAPDIVQQWQSLGYASAGSNPIVDGDLTRFNSSETPQALLASQLNQFIGALNELDDYFNNGAVSTGARVAIYTGLNFVTFAVAEADATKKELFVAGLINLAKLLNNFMLEKAVSVVSIWNSQGYAAAGSNPIIDADLTNFNSAESPQALTAANLNVFITALNELDDYLNNVAVPTADRASIYTNLKYITFG
jgi:hypothetical protein